MKRYLPLSFVLCALCLLSFLALGVMTSPTAVFAQDNNQAPPDRAKIIAAAREIMQGQTYCALITIDETGRPQIRTMNPFPPEEDMTVYMATRTNTRKAEQIRRDPRVTLYYANHATATGYVALTGKAVLIDDMKEIQKRKRAYWDQAFAPGLKDLVLIKVIPEKLDVLNYKAGVVADRETWRTPSIEFGTEKK